jgi:alkylated DNA repair dioxygenase AlkB
MLFDSPTRSSLPSYLQPLLSLLPQVLAPLPEALKSLIFSQTRPRQAILNLYIPGQGIGISPHIDLPTRYEDGIVGVSLLGSTVMDFSLVDPASNQEQMAYSIRLRPGDVYVLSGDARWKWSHGIAYREEDWVEDEEGQPMQIRRGIRMSITLRRMREGADLVG